MRNWINLFESTINDGPADVLAVITHKIRTKMETYVASVYVEDGDHGALPAIIAAVEEAGAKPVVVTLGHSLVGREISFDMFEHDNVVILEVMNHNIEMSMGQIQFRKLEECIRTADRNGDCQVILVLHGNSPFSDSIFSRFQIMHLPHTGEARDLDDGGIHRIT